MNEVNKMKWTAVAITVIISGFLTYWGIMGIGEYGMALFVLTPLFIGVCPVVIYGLKKSLTKSEARNIGFLTLLVFAIALLVFAMEGLICIAMAAPIGLLLTWLGTLIGHRIIDKTPNTGATAAVILMLAIPTTTFIEKGNDKLPELTEIKTSIEIQASPDDVWKNVIEFPTLNETRCRQDGLMRFCVTI